MNEENAKIYKIEKKYAIKFSVYKKSDDSVKISCLHLEKMGVNF